MEPEKTPLYKMHLGAGARIVEFGGWLMPVQYTSILAEHRAVREAVGLFDLCHMGEIEVTGPQATDFVQRVATNDASRLAVDQAQYSLLCDENGGVVDDVLVYRRPEGYLFVVNAANTTKDFAWLLRHRLPACSVEDISRQTGMLGLQGPLAEATLQPLTDVALATMPYYHCRQGNIAGVGGNTSRALISRTGYTGEDGFELFCGWNDVVALWRTLVAVAAPPALCGLGARDTLRLEAAMPLYGHELDEHTNPFEARLGWVVKLEKPEFVGREALAAIRHAGPRRLLVGLEIVDRGIARNGFPVLSNGQVVGAVTSGTFSPTLQKSIALAYVPTEMAQIGAEFSVDVRGRPLSARVVPLPFYKRKK
ncbi:MAG: glycine cleavage system aminomethyltransferase GcvT [Chloroflexi bacterium]|nr:glycine cleavage system aminomethyltransferase GcvT [Chloroflexota bacterium]